MIKMSALFRPDKNIRKETGMKRMLAVFVFIVFAAGLSSTLHGESTGTEKKTYPKIPYTKFKRVDKKVGGFTKHFKESVFKATDQKLYSVEVLLFDGNLKVGVNNFDIVVHDNRDRDVGGAKLHVVARMPENGLESEPRVKAGVPGLYSIEDLDIGVPGPCELAVTVTHRGKEDRAVFQFPDVR